MEEVCTKVLTLEPDNVKALLRRGSARLKQRNSDGAQADLQRCAPASAPALAPAAHAHCGALLCIAG